MATFRRSIIYAMVDTSDRVIKRLKSASAASAWQALHPDHKCRKDNYGWEVMVRRKGHKSMCRTFRLKVQAEKWAGIVEERIAGGHALPLQGIASTRDGFLLRDVLERYKKDITSQRPGKSGETSRVNLLITKLGHHTQHSLMSEHVVNYVRERIAGGKATGTVLRELTNLSDAINMAKSMWRIPWPSNPVSDAKYIIRKLRLMEPAGRRERRLREGEEEKLMGAPLSYNRKTGLSLIKEIVAFALETAMRREEIIRMRREDVTVTDGTSGTVHIRKSKTDHQTGKRGRIVPLSTKAIEILKFLPTFLDGSVWGIAEPHSVTRAFERLCKRAGIVDLHFHDLRHEATSRLFEKGLPIEKVALFTGHTNWRSLQRYTHPDSQRVSEEMNESANGE